MSLSTKEESPWDVLKRVSDSGVTKYKEELPNETAEEVYDPENNRSNEGAKKLLKEGRETVKNWLSFLNDDDFNQLGIDAQQRAENLSVADFVAITNYL